MKRIFESFEKIIGYRTDKKILELSIKIDNINSKFIDDLNSQLNNKFKKIDDDIIEMRHLIEILDKKMGDKK